MKSIFLKLYYTSFYDPDKPKHTTLKKNWENNIFRNADGGGHMTREKYVQVVMITYIVVDCYEHNFKYGSDQNLLQKAYQKW